MRHGWSERPPLPVQDAGTRGARRRGCSSSNPGARTCRERASTSPWRAVVASHADARPLFTHVERRPNRRVAADRRLAVFRCPCRHGFFHALSRCSFCARRHGAIRRRARRERGYLAELPVIGVASVVQAHPPRFRAAERARGEHLAAGRNRVEPAVHDPVSRWARGPVHIHHRGSDSHARLDAHDRIGSTDSADVAPARSTRRREISWCCCCQPKITTASTTPRNTSARCTVGLPPEWVSGTLRSEISRGNEGCRRSLGDGSPACAQTAGRDARSTTSAPWLERQSTWAWLGRLVAMLGSIARYEHCCPEADPGAGSVMRGVAQIAHCSTGSRRDRASAVRRERAPRPASQAAVENGLASPGPRASSWAALSTTCLSRSRRRR